MMKMAGPAASKSGPLEVVTILTPLSVEFFDPRYETPLFAAGIEFTRETSGPITSAFLDSLPDDWRQGRLIIDSALVWLGAGFRQGEMIWCHEPFPGRTDGVPGRSNVQRHAEHIACCCGPTGIDFLAGAAVEAEWTDAPQTMDEIRRRHVRLQHAVDARDLSIRSVPPATMYQYRWGAFHRHQRAACSGFQFWIRATKGDDRPLVNGIRNATNL